MALTEKEIAELQAKAAKADQLEADNKKLAADKAEFERKETERKETERKEKLKLRRKEIDDLGESNVKSGKWKPAQREAFRKAVNYDDDAKVLDADLESLKALFGTTSGADFTKDSGDQGNGDNGDENESPTDKIVRLTRERQLANPKESFESASFAVMRAYPQLAKQHINGDAAQ